MPVDDDADDDVGGFDPPLPPDDRLWRHPSEIMSEGHSPGRPPASPSAVSRRAGTWSVAVVATLVGAALSTTVMAVTGALSEDVERAVVEKVAVTPIVSSPLVSGERGVVAVAQRLGPTVARLVLTRPGGVSIGSAVIFRDNGLLLTSARLVAGATAIDVVLADGRHFEGRLVGIDLSTDVAVVEIDADHLPVAILGSSDNLEVGSPTVVLGSALVDGQAPAVSSGVISSIDRRVDDDGDSLHGMIQSDAPAEVGGAGGPLADANGAVIGIVAPMRSADRYCFATPIDLARRVAGQLIAVGYATHGWLGIEGADLTPEQAQGMTVEGGVRIRGVQDGSPASTSGLAVRDVITDVGGETVHSASALVVAVRKHQPGDRLTVGYWRDDQHHELVVILGQHR